MGIKRKFLIILFCSLLLINTAACSSGNKASGKSDTGSILSDEKFINSMKKLSQELTMEMENDNFERTYSLLSATAQSTISKERLKEAFHEVIKPIGKFISFTDVTVSKPDKVLPIFAFSKHEGNTLKLIFSWNESGKLDGLWLNYAAKGEIPEEKAETYSTGEGVTDRNIKVGKYELDGMISKPSDSSKDRKTIALLVQGSGPSDMDETIGAKKNKPFRDLAQGLAEYGISTLRYNKRYFQKPELAKEEGQMTIQSEVLDDVASALKLIKDDPEFKDYKIAVIGHSMGGMLLPAILKSDPDIKVGISMAGSLRTLWDIILDQNLTLTKLTSDQEKEIREAVAKADALKEAKGETIMNIPDTYIASFNNLDLKTTMSKLDVPVLAVWGKEDFQVSKIDLDSWNVMSSVTVKEYDGLNHLFMPTSGLKTIEDYNTEAHVDKTVIKDIAEFIIKEAGR